MLRTVFFGTSAFAVPALDVAARRSELLAVVTQPDRPAGRGQHLQQSAVKRAALERSLPVYEPQSLRAFAVELQDIGVECFIVASYGRILPQALLALPALGSLGIHPSLLPRFRGATPIQAALLAGDRETGVTLMLMDAGMDTGDVVLQERLAILAGESYGALHDRLAHLGARLLGEALAIGEHDGAFPRRSQVGEASLTRPIRKEDLEIDWRWPGAKIVNHVRAYAPQPAARAVLAGVHVKILRAKVGGTSLDVARRSRASLARDGTVESRPLGRPTVARDDTALLVPCGDGVVAIELLIAPNRGRESGTAFARRMGIGVP